MKNGYPCCEQLLEALDLDFLFTNWSICIFQSGSEAVNDSDTETDISFSEGDLVEEVSPGY